MLFPIAAIVLTQATANPPHATRIDDRVREYFDAGLSSGVVVVARGNDIVYQKAFGLADRTFNVPNTVDTKFHIASVSKPITAAAVLLLAERGKLSIEDHVSKFVPDFPNGDRITIEELLTHYSGLDAAGFEKPPYFDWTAKTGNGSLYTTAGDLLKFHRALQHGGLLKPDTVTSSYGFDPAKRDRTVGMFWYRRNENGHRSVYISGSSPGFKAHFERLIDDDVAGDRPVECLHRFTVADRARYLRHSLFGQEAGRRAEAGDSISTRASQRRRQLPIRDRISISRTCSKTGR